jgi:hypothetical protein
VLDKFQLQSEKLKGVDVALGDKDCQQTSNRERAT